MLEPVCPLVDPALGSICVQSCRSNSDCDGDALCCPNSCGLATCADPTLIPYYGVPSVCPSTSLQDLFGTCLVTDLSCTANSECEDGKLCCRDRCGRTCQDAVRSAHPCFAVTELIRSVFSPTNPPPPGYYVPTCQDSGLFNVIQCSSSSDVCWCADIQTGRPLSSYYPRGITPQCSGISRSPLSLMYDYLQVQSHSIHTRK